MYYFPFLNPIRNNPLPISSISAIGEAITRIECIANRKEEGGEVGRFVLFYNKMLFDDGTQEAQNRRHQHVGMVGRQ